MSFDDAFGVALMVVTLGLLALMARISGAKVFFSAMGVVLGSAVAVIGTLFGLSYLLMAAYP